MELLDRWHEQAASSPKRIVLADAGDERAQQAAAELNDRGLAVAAVIEDPSAHVTDEVRAVADGLDKPVDLTDPLHVATLLVAAGQADGCVAGAGRPTADVIRAGLRILGTETAAPVSGTGKSAPVSGTGLPAPVSSCFLLVLPDGRPVAYGDCGVLPDPDEGQLASVAVASARTFRQLTGNEPRVAMLSFSTRGSAEHPKVDKVRAATELVREAEPDLAVDGELQFDAAFVPSVGEAKAPGSAVAGGANVFIFPDLASGNIGYKITERLAGARAFGPLLQGLNGILHDLSRGCSTDDIVTVSVIAALQAAAR